MLYILKNTLQTTPVQPALPYQAKGGRVRSISIAQAMLVCTMLSVASASPVKAGTVLNTASPVTDKPADGPSYDIFGTLFGSGASAPADDAATADTATDNTTMDVRELQAMGSPDSSPALFATRTELDMPESEPDNSPALFADREELDTPHPEVVQVEQVAARETSEINVSDTKQAAADPLLGEPDDSPSLFADRRELEPAKDDKMTGILTSLMKPFSGKDDENKTADNHKEEEGKPVASYESPGAVVKKERLKQAQYQTGVDENQKGVELASLVPKQGYEDNGPLIQLPGDPLPGQKPVAVQAPAKKPQPVTGKIAITEKTAKKDGAEPTEPRRELSPTSKAILNNIPADINASPKASTDPIEVERAREKKASQAKPIRHEEMGISIEVKKPSMDMNYELEKAYNATIAGETGIAMDIYQNILHNDANNKVALFGLGTLYHRAGQIDTARKLYSKLLTIDPSNRDALNNFLVLLADEAPEAALEQLSKLEKRDPKFSPIPAQMAIIYQKLGDLDSASQKMFRAIDLAPENMVYRYNLAIMLDKQQKYDEAGKLYYQIIEAYQRGQNVPGDIQQIQQRLTFIRSNK